VPAILSAYFGNKEEAMSMVVRAIDLGFGNTKFVMSSVDGKIECSHFPSLAVLAPGEMGVVDLVGKRKTVCVPVRGVWYEVGYDVEQAASAFKARPRHDRYIETAEYMALTAGALRYMGCKSIDLLVVGLPVAEYLAKRKELEKLLKKEPIQIGGGDSVTIKEVMVLAQPHGALFDYLRQHGEATGIKETKNLVIDVGYRTFDWLTTDGLKVYANRSHSVSLGVSQVLGAIARKIGIEHGMAELPDLDGIDRALRQKKPLAVFQKSYELKKFQADIDAVADQAVGELYTRIGQIYDIRNVVLVGGGAFLYKRSVAKLFNRHKILEVSEPLLANVRGFQYLGEQQGKRKTSSQAASVAAPIEVSPAAGA
jgi:plasmid segregation protein ParM